MGKLDGKVAFVTGGARGQGREHCVRMAGEGADIITLDICADVDTIPYPLATEGDLRETVSLVERLGRQIFARQADVRDFSAVSSVLEEGVQDLGRLDVVVANAGVNAGMAVSADQEYQPLKSWHDVLDIDLGGVFHTVYAAIPILVSQNEGGSIVITSSMAGLKGYPNLQAGAAAYTASKHGVVGLMKQYAVSLAPHSIRVNTVHPTGVRTPMVVNEAMGAFFAANGAQGNMLPVDMVESADVSNAVLWLASADARYVTGMALTVDAGNSLF